MNNESIQCLFESKQMQLKMAMNLVRYHMKNLESPTLYWSVGNCIQCNCGCERIAFCGVIADAVSTRIRLNGTKQYVKLGEWELVAQNKNSAMHCFVNQVKIDNFVYGEEVMMLGESKDSALCSVLTAKGTLHNVINLDWSGFDEPEEATT